LSGATVSSGPDAPGFRANNPALDEAPGPSAEKAASITGLSGFGVDAASSEDLSVHAARGELDTFHDRG
jgi:hypothetical protein